MNRTCQLPAWLGAALGTVCALFAFAAGAHASDHTGDYRYTEEFHQTYTIAPDGSVELDNINGAVHVSVWDRSEVKVDAVKYADSKERLDEAKIEIDATQNHISIRTKYPHHDMSFNWGSRNNPAGVEYTLTVPQAVRLDELNLINGSLDITGASGEVHASCVNGRLEAHNLSGRAELSTVNGRLEANFDRLYDSSIELTSVNGSVRLTLPSDAKAEIEAETVSGGIENDFGLRVVHHHFVGHNLRGQLGAGGARIKLENVNGRIEIHHANDGKAMSPVRDLSERDRDEEDDSEI